MTLIPDYRIVSLRSVIGSVAVAALLGMTLGSAAAMAQKSPAKHPSLHVVSVKPDPAEPRPLHRFLRGDPVTYTVKLRNDGDWPSPKGENGVLLSQAANVGAFTIETTFEVPRVKPQKTVELEVYARGRGFGKPDQITTAVPEVCVPVNGTAHFDNKGNLKGTKGCHKGDEFAVIPKVWSGTISSSADLMWAGSTGKARSDARPTFTYAPLLSDQQNKFVYDGAGDLIYSASASGGGCSVSGGKNSRIRAGDGRLYLSPDLLEYSADINTVESYTATLTCFGQSYPQNFITSAFGIPPTTRDAVDVTDTKLTGNRSAAGIGGSVTLNWDLDAT